MQTESNSDVVGENDFSDENTPCAYMLFIFCPFADSTNAAKEVPEKLKTKTHRKMSMKEEEGQGEERRKSREIKL
jgi:hypothetical protein